MIRIVLRYGTATRIAPTLEDSLISTTTAALRRGEQELAASNYIVFEKAVTVPHDPTEQLCGTETTDLTYGRLGIFGVHAVISRSISLSKDGATENITLEQYREMK
jgi:hypothetical protein